jgi:hypothetical protein
MPVKTVLMLRRKPGMTPEAFRQEYETGHSRLGLKLFGHLWVSYKRHYPISSFTFSGGANPAPYDAITEVVYRDQAALEESGRIAAANQKLLSDDEERLFDRPNCHMTIVEMLEEKVPTR